MPGVATMAKSITASVKAAWEVAKKDFKENSHADLLKQDVIDVLDLAKNRASLMKKSSSSKWKLGAVQSSKIGPQVNQDVGAELLAYFKEQWAEIHESTETASKVAIKMDSDLKQLNQSITASHTIIDRCREEFVKLKEMVEALDEAQSKVECISGLVAQVEQDIREYSRMKAELDAERERHSLQRQHETAIMENRGKVELLRKVVMNEQQLSLNLKHEMESNKLRERQDAFQEIFDKQMADYRTRGEVDKPIGLMKERSPSLLEEVVIEDEDGTASLHEFLSDVVMDDVQTGDMPTESQTTPTGAKDTPTDSQDTAAPSLEEDNSLVPPNPE